MLEIWNKAKGKEADALLWGDEVSITYTCINYTSNMWLIKHQVEYLVVVYSKDNDSPVLLSLRQADILEALASDKSLTAKGGCVPALQEVPGAE